MRVQPLDGHRLHEAASLISRCQRDPDTFVAYFSDTTAAIESELHDLEPDGLRGTLTVISDDGELAGLLGAEHDRDPARVWWHGPFVASPHDSQAVADLLYGEVRRRLPADVAEEECAFDDRSRPLADFARRHGFHDEEASAILAARLPLPAPPPSSAEAAEVITPDGVMRAMAARLHDELFPGAHSTGLRAVRSAEDRVVRVAVHDGQLVGYVAAERQADGSGYLDFLGVLPGQRGRGLGAALVMSACDALHHRHGCAEVHLTVRASSRSARRVYQRAGFTEERLLRPWRKGFTLS